MRYIKIPVIIISIFLFHIAAYAGIREYCENKWPGNYEMISYCEGNQFKAYHKLLSYGEKLGLVKDGVLSASPDGNNLERIIYDCMGKWESPAFDTYNFEMVIYCIENQFEAYYRLYPEARYKKPYKKKKPVVPKKPESERRDEPPMEPMPRKNIFYETGSTIKLHNHSDTTVAIYKDESLSNSIIYFTNGIKATVTGFKKFPDKSIAYKVQILLKDNSEYTGWVHENVIRP